MTKVFELAAGELAQLGDARRAAIKTIMTPVHNVAGYGAKGDGITDDTAAIQDTINAAIAAGGKSIWFPPGAYKVTALTSASQMLFLGDNATFVGYSGTIIQLGRDDKTIMTPVHNVAGYGAKGDGIKDDTAAIQDTINAAIAAGGKSIWFPPGAYKATVLTSASQMLFLGDNATFVGYSGTIIQLGRNKQFEGWYDLKDQGAKGDGVTDDTAILEAALALGNVYAPPGTYVISRKLAISTTRSLVGASCGLTTFKYTGTGACFTVGNEAAVGFPDVISGKLADFRITGPGSAVVGVIGVLIVKALHATVERVLVADCATGFMLNGMDLWCASCNLFDPRTIRVKYGLVITAANAKEVNHTNVFGGYIYGDSPGTPFSTGVLIEQGNTNAFHGTAVEGFDVGFGITSQNAVGQRFYGTRSEACNQGFLINTGSIKNIVIGHSEPVIFGGGEGSSGVNTVISDNATFPTVATLPVVGLHNRGMILRIVGGAGVADNLYMSRKKADESYEWAALAP